MKTLLLIDANALVHRAYHALPPLVSPEGKPVQALYGIGSILLKVLREEKPEYAAALYDRPEPTFRKREYEEYKAHRPEAADELIAQIVSSRDLFIRFGIPVFEIPGFEADDLIGTAAEMFKGSQDLKIIILTGDLDALQLVDEERVVVKTLKTGVSDTVVYDEKAVQGRYGLAPRQLADYKALVGDPSDNIPGLRGVGPKTASALLQKYGTLEDLYKNLDREPKIREKFASAEKEAFLYKKLATIDRRAPLEIGSLQNLAVKAPGQELADFFRSLGFESLVKRMAGPAGRAPRAGAPVSREAGSSPSRQAPALFAEPLPRIPKRKIVILKNGEGLAGHGERELLPSKELFSDKVKVGFDIKGAIKALAAKKIALPGPYFDLGVGFWLLDPDFKKYSPASAFKKFLNREWTGSDEDYMLAHDYLSRKIESDGLKKIEEIEMPLVEILAEMERAGIAIDKNALAKLSADITEELRGLTGKIYEAAGEKINLNSPKQLSALLLKLGLYDGKSKKTATGQRSTDVETLALLRGRHPVIEHLLAYRELFKLKSTYIEPIGVLTDPDGRLRTDFIQTGTATGRLSSREPNLQNIPAAADGWAKRLRSIFTAKEGSKLVAFDYSQLELRILAAVSEDKKMIEAFTRGDDIHALTAATVFKVSPGEVKPSMRRLAKTLNFGIVYGMGETAFAKTAGVRREEAREFIGNYFSAFPGIRIWHEKVKAEGRTFGCVRNMNGRRRMVLGITYGQTRIAAEAERIAINMPIQSLEADILKLAMLEVRKKLRERGVYGHGAAMLLNIHDELLFEIEENIMKEVAGLIQEIMQSVFALPVPLEVNVKSGRNWGEMS